MSKVILINPFEVPPGREEEALAFWDEVAAYMRRQPGFVSTRLHRALMPGARFGLVNVAEWESAGDFARATNAPDFQEMVAPYMESFPHYPALYEVVRS
ncbi:MAG: antibiotic biosynthesis monooxygenase [Desulfarculaceae bacterium]|nr:antibiotic biosynthesis monooxygenase [Desulfarculaceae bacterium]